MLVMTLRTVTFMAAWRWCSRRTISSALVPCAARSSSSQPSAGVTAGSWSRSRWKSWTRPGVDSAASASRRSEAAVASGLSRAEAEQAVGELVRLCRAFAAADDRLGQAAQVLDQDDAQADGDRPELADRQRLDPLVGAHETAQALRVEAAVGVSDVRPRQADDPGIPLEVALGELGQLAVVVRGQVVADLAQLLVDDVEVVDEPFGGRRDRALVLDRTGQCAVGGEQDPPVLGDAGPERAPRRGSLGDRLGGGERRGVLLEALDAEQLRDDRLGVVEDAGRPADRSAHAERPGPQRLDRSHLESIIRAASRLRSQDRPPERLCRLHEWQELGRSGAKEPHRLSRAQLRRPAGLGAPPPAQTKAATPANNEPS